MPVIKFTCGVWLTVVLFLNGETLARTIIVGTSESPPLTTQSMQNFGLINHRVKQALALEGFEVEFEFLNWSRIYEGGIEGKYDVITYAYDKVDHQLHFLLSDPVSFETVSFLVRSRNAISDWDSLDDLKKFRMGLTRGYSYTRDLWQYAEQNASRVSVVNTDKQNIGMLKLERIDLFPIGELHGNYLRQTLSDGDDDGLQFIQPPLMTTRGRVLFPKVLAGSEALREVFNRRLAEVLMQEGLHCEEDEGPSACEVFTPTP